MVSSTDLIKFENEIKALWEAGQIKAPVHFCGGNEEQLIEVFKEIRPNDYVFSGHRNHYHYLLHAGDGDALRKEMLREPDGLCRGRSGSMGTIDRSHNFFSSAIVGGCCGIAVGVAWALKDAGSPRRVWCFVGDGAVDGGHFWEALQYAHGWDLPITFVVEDNDRSTCTSVTDRLGTRESLDGAWRTMLASKHIWHYEYVPTYPHVGSGKYVAF